MKATNDSAEYKITCQMKTLGSFIEKYVKLYESSTSTFKVLDNEQLKKSFQLALAIEKFFDHIEKKGQSEMSNGLIRTVLADKKLSPTFDITILKKACNYLLEKMFLSNEYSLSKIAVAVRIYTSMLPSYRYEEFLCDLLMESASYKAIEEFIFENKIVDIKSLQFKILMNEWVIEHKKGKTNELVALIQDMMSQYKVKQSLYALIGIIASETDSEEESLVREIVLKEVLDKMFCRSILSENFWLILFKVDDNLLLNACKSSEEFHVSICNFLIFIGSMMDKIEDQGDTMWVPNSVTSIFPNITYDILVSVLGPLCSLNFSKRSVTLKKLLQAEEDTECEIWRHILLQL
ncbi:uncharacterized protein LOC123684074 [Harmonia axyridis]|uniref:uncharacterized protein LOC123684074 n=1 Tax=Harmonia axyridis TaxID=115357 RepID=UPI001E277619|nr:uncharacterized protein LOC123684074 [Harmonia axyridis]XP_045479140.1 uncharacterized protein LOC123684074 [Harmonia axyridis]